MKLVLSVFAAAALVGVMPAAAQNATPPAPAAATQQTAAPAAPADAKATQSARPQGVSSSGCAWKSRNLSS